MTNMVGNYRRFLGYSQKEIADFLNISLQAYWRKENGKTPFNDNEKIQLVKLFKNKLKSTTPTIESIFFS